MKIKGVHGKTNPLVYIIKVPTTYLYVLALHDQQKKPQRAHI